MPVNSRCDDVIVVIDPRGLTADHIRSLAARVARLCPSPRNPEAFWEEKSEIADELRRLAKEASHG